MRTLRRQLSVGTTGWYATAGSRTSPFVLIAFVVLATLVMNLLGFGGTTVETLIMLTAVIGLYSYSGVTGIASFGHVAYMAVGGYVAMLLTVPSVVKGYRLPGLPSWLAHTEMDPYLALVIAGLAGVVVAAVFGLIVWRLNGLAAGIATLALLLALFTVAGGWESVTGGSGAVPGVPQISSTAPSLLVAMMAILATGWFQRTRWARFAQAAREDAPAAEAIGIRIHLAHWLAMTFSGGVMAVAGALYVYFVGSISPDFFYIPMMFNLLAILVIGGMLSMTGAVAGTIVVEFLRQILAPLDNGWTALGWHYEGRPGLRFVVLGALMLLMLARRPGGLVNGYEVRLPAWRRPRRKTTSAGAPISVSAAPPGSQPDVVDKHG